MSALHPDVERLALLGWRLYPCSRTSKRGCMAGATDLATHDLDQLAEWSRQYPGCNWRVVFKGSGIWGIDVDAPSPDHAADGISALASMVKRNGPLPPRPMTRSGGGGMALFFRHRGEPISGRTGTPAPGIDPRRGRLSVTVPPSIHVRTRQPYRWLVAPWDVAPPDAPAWLMRLVAPPPEPPVRRVEIDTSDRARRALWRAVDAVRNAGAGTRNETLNRRAFGVARLVAAHMLHESEAVEALYAAAREAGLAHPEIKATVQSAFRSGFRAGPPEARA